MVRQRDGSSDGTRALLERTFQLVAAPMAFGQPLRSARVRGLYRSIGEPNLAIVDEENGRSKADASNAGFKIASGVLMLDIDADTVLEADALSRCGKTRHFGGSASPLPRPSQKSSRFSQTKA